MCKRPLFTTFFLALSYLLLAQAPNGSVINSRVIGEALNGFGGTLSPYDAFGAGLTAIGDLDNDGVEDLAIGAPGRSSGAPTDGAVWILFMNSDGTVKDEYKIDEFSGDLTDTIPGQEAFGQGLAYLGDLDGDGRPELAVGAPGNTNAQGLNPADSGAVYILSLNPNGTVQAQTLLGNNRNGLPDTLDNGDHFGYAVANAGDLNGDGRPELAVGSWGYNGSRGAIYVLFLNADGTVDDFERISQAEATFEPPLSTSYHFGCSIARIDDVNRDGLPDLAVGAYGSDEGGSFRGALWILRMQPDGTAANLTTINGDHPLLRDTLNDFDYLGWSVAHLGDLDGDGRGELAVGAPRTNTGGNGSAEGQVYVLYLGGEGVLRSFSLISEDDGNLQQSIPAFASLGSAVANPGDLDGDGLEDLLIGAPGYGGGVNGEGAFFRLTLEGQGEASVQGRVVIFPDGQSQTLSGGQAYLFDLYDEDPDLFGHDTTAQTAVNANGEFTFTNVPLRDYFLKVVPPTDTLFDGYYVADTASRPLSFRFKSALQVQGDTTLSDVFVRQFSAGTNTRSTFVGYAYFPDRPRKRSTEELIEAADIPLLLSVTGSDSVVGFTRTDSLGFFTLGGMIPGDNYDLLVDVPGLPMDSATAIDFTYPSNTDTLEVAVLIDSAAIFLDFNPATNLETMRQRADGLRLGPVPARTHLMVRWQGKVPASVHYRIRDLQGRVLPATLDARGEITRLDLRGLPPGVYLLEARSADGLWLRKFRKE